LNDTVKADAHGQSPEREPYGVQARDTMDRVIKKTFPTTPLSREVMREAVSIDLWNFKKGLELICERCGSTKHPSVDHVDPPFDGIEEQFIEANGLPAIDDAADGVGNVFADHAVEVSWIKFHMAHAKYQILCRSCNSSKGKR
jgi:hypothetical protein